MKETKKVIVFDADPFCYGPISTMLNIVEELCKTYNLKDQFKLVLLGTLTTSQLAAKTTLFDEIIECNTTDLNQWSQHRDLINSSHAYIINTNRASVEYSSKLNVKRIFVDTLFWMWDSFNENFSSLDLYISQRFVNDDLQLKKYKPYLPEIHFVGPLVGRVENKDIDHQLILCTLGGIDTVYSKTNKFYQKFLEALLPQFSTHDKKIVICGGGETIKNLQRKYGNMYKNIHIEALAKSSLMGLLARAGKVIANPGLTTFYECCHLQKDIYFLPPQNYSQYQQLLVYQNILENYRGFLDGRHLHYPAIPTHLPEMEGVALVNKAVNALIDDEEAMNTVAHETLSYINGVYEPLKSKVDFSDNGVIQASELIFQELTSND